MGGDPDTDLLFWLRETADEIEMSDDSLRRPEPEGWPSTVAFVERHIRDEDRPELVLATMALHRLGYL